MPIFEELSHLGRKSKNTKSQFVLESLSNVDGVLGKGWNTRIFYRQGDFAYVEPNTVTFWLMERRPLEEFSCEGNLTLIHRGFCFRMQFARGLGNRFDYK